MTDGKGSNTRHSEYIRARKGGVIKVSESPSVTLHIFNYAVGFPNCESWSLGDSAAIGILISHNSGRWTEVTAPLTDKDGKYSIPDDGKKIRWYTDLNNRLILEDFFAKVRRCK